LVYIYEVFVSQSKNIIYAPIYDKKCISCHIWGHI